MLLLASQLGPKNKNTQKPEYVVTMSVLPGTRFLWVSQTRPAQPLTTLSGMVYYGYSYRSWTTKVHYTTTKATKVVFYIHYENVLNRVAATSAATSSSILYPKKLSLRPAATTKAGKHADRHRWCAATRRGGRRGVRPAKLALSTRK